MRETVIPCDCCGKTIGVGSESEPLVEVKITKYDVSNGVSYYSTEGDTEHELCNDCGEKVKAAVRATVLELQGQNTSADVRS